MTNTKIELPKEKQELFNELAASYGSDPVTEPIWTDGKTINEPLFAEMFLKTHKLAYCEGAFFGPDGRLDDPEPLRAEVFEILRPYVTTKLYQIYTFWCEENAFVPLRRKSFSSVMIANQEKYHVQYDNRIHNTAGRRVWGFHGIEAVIDPHTGSYYNDFSRTYVPNRIENDRS